jgi:LysM repeat protein
MNSNPLFSPETAAADEKNQGRVRVKIAVFSIVAVHVAGLMALLLTQGCKRHTESDVTPQPDVPTMDTNVAPPMDTNIPPGMTTNVYVPPEPPPTPQVPPEPAAAAATKYVVQPGDSFYTIAKAHGVSLKAIEAANPTVDAKKLQPKQEINVPAPAPASTPAPAPTADAGGPTVYTVKSGDNLSKIASQFHTTPKAIKALNGLTTDQIKVNQKLKIPAKAAAVPETAPVVPTMTAPTEAPAPAPAPATGH